jgi:colicin import membrane protein
LSATVVSCNGDAVVVRSIEAAVRKASPLPRPPNPLLFDADLVFEFTPGDQ